MCNCFWFFPTVRQERSCGFRHSLPFSCLRARNSSGMVLMIFCIFVPNGRPPRSLPFAFFSLLRTPEFDYCSRFQSWFRQLSSNCARTVSSGCDFCFKQCHVIYVGRFVPYHGLENSQKEVLWLMFDLGRFLFSPRRRHETLRTHTFHKARKVVFRQMSLDPQEHDGAWFPQLSVRVSFRSFQETNDVKDEAPAPNRLLTDLKEKHWLKPPAKATNVNVVSRNPGTLCYATVLREGQTVAKCSPCGRQRSARGLRVLNLAQSVNKVEHGSVQSDCGSRVCHAVRLVPVGYKQRSQATLFRFSACWICPVQILLRLTLLLCRLSELQFWSLCIADKPRASICKCLFGQTRQERTRPRKTRQQTTRLRASERAYVSMHRVTSRSQSNDEDI